MLTELTINDLAIIDELHLQLAPGFNVLTGETGAGKSIIIDAVSLLLGGRAEAEIVRAGTERAQVHGLFHLAPATGALIEPILAENGLESDEPDALTLAREVRKNGRSVCRVNGRAVSLGVLRDIGQYLVDIHGQSEHLSLLRVREHINLLDRYADLWDKRTEFGRVAAQLRQVQRELEALLQDEREMARRVDLLQFQIEEITSAKLKPGEDAALEQERTRLANAEQLAALADEVYQSLYEGEGETPAALDALAQAGKALNGLAKIDPTLGEHLPTLESASAQIDDLARTIRAYRERIEFSPKRLDYVQDRLDTLKRLKRKYGGALEEILAFAQNAAAQLDGITHASERIQALREQEDQLLRQVGALGRALSDARRTAAEKLAAGIEAELNDLKMAGARFGVDMHWTPQENGAYVGEGRYAFDSTGLDKVEFLVAPNVGEGLKPLAKIASGGETSRLMLALKAVLARADQTPTLIFDEIDQGIGGRVGSVVGRKLWELTADRGRPAGGLGRQTAAGTSHQVICITHLPQLAGYGDAHLRVEKGAAEGRTLTRVEPLDDQARVQELAQMLGASGQGAVQSAQEILASVAKEKHAL
jgi:DNA repair protein RecN (Recombination protein N)